MNIILTVKHGSGSKVVGADSGLAKFKSPTGTKCTACHWYKLRVFLSDDKIC